MGFYYFIFSLVVLTSNGGYFLIRKSRGEEHAFSIYLFVSSVALSVICLVIIRKLKQRAEQIDAPQRPEAKPVPNSMITYYMMGVFFVIMTNIASGFIGSFEQILNVPFFLFTLLIAGVTLAEIRKLKKKADRYDAEYRG